MEHVQNPNKVIKLAEQDIKLKQTLIYRCLTEFGSCNEVCPESYVLTFIQSMSEV